MTPLPLRPVSCYLFSGIATLWCRELQVSADDIKILDKRLEMTDEQQLDLKAHHVDHGLPIYRTTSGVHAYLLYHNQFVSAYSPEIQQPMWTAARVSLKQVT